jgi:ACS family hexuronate transporter-like MFS transporter
VLFNSGATGGARLAPAVVPPIAAAWGWQAAFVCAGAAGLLWLVLWIPFFDLPERSRRLGAAERQHIRAGAQQPAAAAPARRPAGLAATFGILRHRQAWSFIVGKFLTDPVWWFFLIWLPDYFKKTRGLDIKKSGGHLVTVYAIVTVVSLAGGWLAGALARRQGWSATRARKTAMLIFALAVVPILFVTKAGTWGAVMLIGLAGGAHQAWSANLFTTVSDMFPKEAVASLVGMGSMAGSLGGILFPIISGELLDHFAGVGDVTAGYAILFSFCGSAYLLAFALNHLLAPRFAPVRRRWMESGGLAGDRD